MAVVGRIQEKQWLEQCFQSSQAEFIALYGRRRIGKTFLIKEYFANSPCFFLRVTGIKDGSFAEQLQHFTLQMGKTFYNGAELKVQTSWMDTFHRLTDIMNSPLTKDRKIVIFLDEFPWMATHKSKLLQALDHFWNHYWCDNKRIKLIICGSSASWIIKKIINNRGGLHNRITHRMQLKPFSLKETQQFLKSKGITLNPWHISQVYMVTGGIPFYLKFIQKNHTAAQIIEQLAFRKNAPLLSEFDNLFASLFDDADVYSKLIRIIAKHRYGISQADITKKTSSLSKGGRIVEKLKALADTGFILKFTPHLHKKKGIYYRIIDEYSLFYLHWIEPIKNTLQSQDLPEGYWQELQLTPTWKSWAGYVFEALVYKHLAQVRAALEIPATAIANSWRYTPSKGSEDDGVQIDLLFDRLDQAITISELKYADKPYVISKAYAQQLKKKLTVYAKQTRNKKQLFLTMICTSGLQENPYADELITKTITLKDLFK